MKLPEPSTLQVFSRRSQLGLRRAMKDENAEKKICKRRRTRKSSKRLGRLRKKGGSKASLADTELAECEGETEVAGTAPKKVAGKKKPKATAEPKAKAKAKAKATAKAKAKSGAKAKAKPQRKPKASPKLKAKGKAKAKARAKRDASGADHDEPEATRRRARSVVTQPDPADVNFMISWVQAFDVQKLEGSRDDLKKEVRYWLPTPELCFLDIYWSRFACGVCFKTSDESKHKKNFCAHFSFGKGARAMLLSVCAGHCLVTWRHLHVLSL